MGRLSTYSPPAAWKTTWVPSGRTPASSSRTAGVTPPQATSGTLQPSTQWKSTVCSKRGRRAQSVRTMRSGRSTSPSTSTTHSAGDVSGSSSMLRTGKLASRSKAPVPPPPPGPRTPAARTRAKRAAIPASRAPPLMKRRRLWRGAPWRLASGDACEERGAPAPFGVLLVAHSASAR